MERSLSVSLREQQIFTTHTGHSSLNQDAPRTAYASWKQEVQNVVLAQRLLQTADMTAKVRNPVAVLGCTLIHFISSPSASPSATPFSSWSTISIRTSVHPEICNFCNMPSEIRTTRMRIYAARPCSRCLKAPTNGPLESRKMRDNFSPNCTVCMALRAGAGRLITSTSIRTHMPELGCTICEITQQRRSGAHSRTTILALSIGRSSKPSSPFSASIVSCN